MTTRSKNISPLGTPHAESMHRRAHNPEYQAELQRLAPYEALARIMIRRRGQFELSQAELSPNAWARATRRSHGSRPCRRCAGSPPRSTPTSVGFADETGYERLRRQREHRRPRRGGLISASPRDHGPSLAMLSVTRCDGRQAVLMGSRSATP